MAGLLLPLGVVSRIAHRAHALSSVYVNVNTISRILSRRRGHLHARALQIRAVLSTHIHSEGIGLLPSQRASEAAAGGR